MHRRNFIELLMGSLGAVGPLGCENIARHPGQEPRRTKEALVKRLDAGSFNTSRRFAETSFGRIAYIERGAGEVALFLHGFPLNGFQWRGALDLLSKYRRCIAPDFMGMGYSEPVYGQSLAADAQVSMLAEFLDKLNISDVDMVANDSGGAVAQLFVARHQKRVRSLILTNCDTELDCPPTALLPVIELSREGRFVDEWLAPWLSNKALARSAEGIGGMCYADPMHPTDEAIEVYFGPIVQSVYRKAQMHAFAMALERNVLQGIAPALRACTAPTRIIWGTGDTIFSPASPDYLDKTFGNSMGIRRLSRSKLFWPEERPDVIAEEAVNLWGVGGTAVG